MVLKGVYLGGVGVWGRRGGGSIVVWRGMVDVEGWNRDIGGVEMVCGGLVEYVIVGVVGGGRVGVCFCGEFRWEIWNRLCGVGGSFIVWRCRR